MHEKVLLLSGNKGKISWRVHKCVPLKLRSVCHWKSIFNFNFSNENIMTNITTKIKRNIVLRKANFQGQKSGWQKFLSEKLPISLTVGKFYIWACITYTPHYSFYMPTVFYVYLQLSNLLKRQCPICITCDLRKERILFAERQGNAYVRS